jgi:hypothetical protein
MSTMSTRNRLLAGVLAAFLALAGLACEVEDFEGDPLEEDGMEDDTWDEDNGEDA